MQEQSETDVHPGREAVLSLQGLLGQGSVVIVAFRRQQMEDFEIGSRRDRRQVWQQKTMLVRTCAEIII